MNEELKIIISAQIDKLKKNVDEAKKHVSGFKDQVKKASENVDKNFAAIGNSMKTGLTVAAGAISAAGTALVALGASTAEYRNEQAKLNTAFEAAGGSATEAKKTYNELFRVLGDGGQATEAASFLAKLTTEEKALSEWTTICQGAYAVFGDSIPVESIAEGALEASKTGAATAGLTDALVWAGISEDAFNEKLAATNSESERERIIRETLNGIYSEAAATYEENNAQVLAQNEAQAKLNESMAKLGEAIAPVMTMLTELGASVLTAISPYLQQFAENYLPIIQEALGKVKEHLGGALTFIKEHQTILTVMAGIIAGIAAAIALYNTVAAIKAAMDAAQVTTLWGLVAAYAAQAAAMVVAIAPYLLIVAAIAAVIAIIVLCVKHWDEIKEATVKAFAKIKEVVSAAIDSVVNFFGNLLNWIKDNWQGLLLLIVNPFAGAFKLAYDNCESFRNAVNSFISKIKEAIQTGFNFVKEKIINPIREAFSAVSESFSKIVSTIREKLNLARDAVQSVLEKIKGFFKFEWSLPKLKLPSVKITGKFSLSPLEVPKFSINWNALGGVFDKPAIFGYGNTLQGIGEDGAEAVVPLEKNTQWLDKIAERLAGKQAKTPLILKVGEKVFAETSIACINGLTRQTGELGLVIR